MASRIAKNQKFLKLVKLVSSDTIQDGEEKAEGIGRICRKHNTKNNSSISENKEKTSGSVCLQFVMRAISWNLTVMIM